MKRITSVFLSLLCLETSTHAKVISVNFERDNSADEITTNSSAGFIPATHWNNINVGATGTRTITIPATPLLDNSGINSTTSLAINLSSAYIGSSGSGTSTPDHAMMASYLSWDPVDGTVPEDTGTVTINNLPAEFTAGYKVYVYFDADVNSRTFDVTVNGTTVTAADASTFSGTFLNASTSPTNGNYAVFTGLTTNTFTIAMNSDSGRAALNGFQVVSDDHTLPPTIELFKANDYYVSPGDPITLNWQTSGASHLTIDQSIGDVTSRTSGGEGTINATVSSQTSYTLTATNSGGSSTATVTIHTGPPRPNIVFFLVDDMGTQDTSVPFNLDAQGTPKKYHFNDFYVTPNMETLAAQGMRFTNAYAQSVCSPTRTGLMTGRNSARHAITDWVGGGGNGSPTNWRNQGLDHTDVTLPKLLQQGGYRTIHVGKGHFGQSGTTGEDPLNLGFDVNIGGSRWGHPYNGYIGTAGYGGMPGLEAYDGSLFLTKALTIEANKALSDAVDRDQPFFLNMSFYAVHAPFTTNPDATGDYSGSTGSNHTKFATMIEGMDIAVGEIRQKLIDLGVAQNTLIVFLGDNGSDSPAVTVNGLPSGSFSDFPIRGKKGSKWEGGSRVPMIACWALPDATNSFQQAIPISANGIETDIVTSWDLPATFLNAAGLPSADNFGEDSHNLLPYFSGSSESHRPQEIIMHYPHNHRSDFFSWIRQGDMKLIYNYQSNSHQLYNLADDPTESNDLAVSQAGTLLQMSRDLAIGLEQRWGDRGALLPTISSTAPSGNVVSIPNDPSIDSDHDGLPDTVEDPNFNGLVDPGETNPDNNNSDGDNINDGDEAKIGTDPLDSNSYFYCHPLKLPDGSLNITWPSSLGSTFTIRSSTDLTDWTTVVASAISATPGSMTTYNLGTSSAPHIFFRVELE